MNSFHVSLDTFHSRLSRCLPLFTQNNLYTSIPTASQTSWMFWNTRKDGGQKANVQVRTPGIQRNPSKISSLQEASDSPQYTTIV